LKIPKTWIRKAIGLQSLKKILAPLLLLQDGYSDPGEVNMVDARVVGIFSILLGGSIVVLSTFLGATPVFLIVGILTGLGILFAGATILATFLAGRQCSECGEILRDGTYSCPICGHTVSERISPSLIRRLLH